MFRSWNLAPDSQAESAEARKPLMCLNVDRQLRCQAVQAPITLQDSKKKSTIDCVLRPGPNTSTTP